MLTRKEGSHTYRYPPEFRRKVLDLLAAGRSVASLSANLGVSNQTNYNWRRQDAVDRGLEPGLTSGEKEELSCPPSDGIRRGLF